jgi:hypothetical protein
MLLLAALTIALVVATASAGPEVDEGRPNRVRPDSCYGNNHPAVECFWLKPKDYPLMSRLAEPGDLMDRKDILQEEDALEDLCSETRSLADCITSSLESASEECLEAYERHQLTTEFVDKVSGFIESLCTEDAIEIFRENLDCIYDRDLYDRVRDCTFENPNLDCTHFDNNEYSSENEEERRECYTDKFRKNCDPDEVISCAVENVETSCGEKAGELMELAGNAFTERFPICPDERKFRSFMRLFKK